MSSTTEPARINDADLKEGTAEFYRRRFESSVLGQHAMLPPADLAQSFLSSELPAPYPSGPNTSFLDPTPMPYRFTEPALESHNARHKFTKPEDPTYCTTTSEFGKLSMRASDYPIRWYGLRGEFTNAFFLGGMAPKNKVNSGLNAAMDRSDIHHVYDQGWSGHLGVRDYNIPSLGAATFVSRFKR